MPSSPTSCDRLYADLLNFIARMADARRMLAIHERGLRLNAYRAAVRYVALQRDHHNQFVVLLKSYGKDIDALIEEWFGPLRVINEDPFTLLKAVSEGLTQKQWMSQSAASYLDTKKRERIRKDVEAAAESVAAPPPEALPVEVQLAEYKRRDAARADLLANQASMIRALETENARLKKELADVRRTLQRLQRRLTTELAESSE